MSRLVMMVNEAAARQCLTSWAEQLGPQLELVNFSSDFPPDVIVTDGMDLPSVTIPCLFVGSSRAVIEALAAANPQVTWSHVLLPTTVDDFALALRDVIDKFRLIGDLKQRNQELKQELDDQRDIAIAKGLIQRRFRCSEAEAYERLVAQAQERRISTIAYSREIIEANKSFQPSRKKRNPGT